jgi:predicted DsbA family dithiol-disulfide isomerase
VNDPTIDAIEGVAATSVPGWDHHIEVFADITCPFTHIGLRRLVAERDVRGSDHRILVSSWPLELVNADPARGPALVPKIATLRRTVAPDLFRGFDPNRFPASSLPALGLVAAAYQHDVAAGEQLSLAVRTALFEEGADIVDPSVLETLATRCGLPGLARNDQQVIDDWHRGEALGVIGSPHFYVAGGSFFCPALEITHPDEGLSISFDVDGFDQFLAVALA